MKISSIMNPIKTFSQNPKQNKKNTSFKSIYVEDTVWIGHESERRRPPIFKLKDELLLEEISNRYPYQDCFIRRGYEDFPRLEYRVKPTAVTVFDVRKGKKGKEIIEPVIENDEEHPFESILLYQNSPMTKIVGVPSAISLNPSLANTILMGFELHKKILAQEKFIMDEIGSPIGVSLGDETIRERAHRDIRKTENAVTRYLLESAYVALTDVVTTKQLFDSNYPKVKTRLEAKRNIDLLNSIAKQKEIDERIKKTMADDDSSQPVEQEETAYDEIVVPPQRSHDILEEILKAYPKDEDNRRRNEELLTFMNNRRIFL